MKRYIFDVDGTLTPSRDVMNSMFQLWFENFVDNNYVYLVTGSDYPKTVEQVGEYICTNADYVYNCNGNSIWYRGENVHNNNWKLPEEAEQWLQDQLTQSKFPKRTGLHLEQRPGMVNFSVVGRNANYEERAEYVQWDEEHNERKTISDNFNKLFQNLQATVGGETGLDIAPKGFDKSQVLNDFLDIDEIHFFGDKMNKGGNDYSLAKAILDNNRGYCYNVQNWETTWKLLIQIQNV